MNTKNYCRIGMLLLMVISIANAATFEGVGDLPGGSTQSSVADVSADGSVVVDARLNIEQVEEHFNVELPREKFDTIGGFVVDLLGNVPEVDQSLEACGLTFTILQSDSRRINKMKIEPVVNDQADV